MSMPPPPQPPGGGVAPFDGRYELQEQLGSGQYGEVWRARDRHRGHVVALKILDATKTTPDAAWREATRLTTLASPYILKVNNAALAADVPYIDTQLATGGSAAAAVAPWGVSPQLAVLWARQAGVGLALCHRRGLLHRDVKPENIFLDANGDACLGDFGVAAVMDGNGEAQPSGDPQVRAPEVLKGGFCTVASDVWSLGITLYALLAGSLPHRWADHGSFPALRTAILGGTPDIRDVAPHVPRGLASVVRTATAGRPNDRYSDVGAMVRDLAKVRSGIRAVTRVAPHNQCERCWDAEPLTVGKAVHVCERQGPGRRASVEVRHTKSGNRIKMLCRELPRSSVSTHLRKAFKFLTRVP